MLVRTEQHRRTPRMTTPENFSMMHNMTGLNPKLGLLTIQYKSGDLSYLTLISLMVEDRAQPLPTDPQ